MAACSTVDYLAHQYQISGLLPGTSGTWVMFDNRDQDAWREMELCNQSSPFRLTEDREFIFDGLGHPFKRLYFQARTQLCYAMDELIRI